MKEIVQPSGNIPNLSVWLWRLLETWCGRRSQRQILKELEDFHLDDIGITPAERDRECDKWFWMK